MFVSLPHRFPECRMGMKILEVHATKNNFINEGRSLCELVMSEVSISFITVVCNVGCSNRMQ